MRAYITMATLLAVAACGETTGWNPNYGFNSTPYGNYQREQEAALMGLGKPSRTIPVTLPSKSPTVEQLESGVWTATKQNTDLTATRVTRPVAAIAAPAKAADAAAPATGNTTSLLAQYAQVNRHTPGTRLWARSGAANTGACARYAKPDDAQLAFLMADGPQADPAGLDPDGDGYACTWTPAGWRGAQL